VRVTTVATLDKEDEPKTKEQVEPLVSTRMKRKELVEVTKRCLSNMDAKDPAKKELQDPDSCTITTLCSLWGGMGHIYRIGTCLIVKHICLPQKQSLSRGDQRKKDSYQVEANFYEHVAPILDTELKLPRSYLVDRDYKGGMIIAMSNIDHESPSFGDWSYIQAVLRWLATLHGRTWGKADKMVQLGLQPMGSYWHLDTRPDEHDSMPDTGWEGRLKMAARAICDRLQRDSMQCIIHGDCKDANVLYDKGKVTMCDFQYCGKACPAVDLVYFFCSSVGTSDEERALEYYLECLCATLKKRNISELPTLSQFRESMDIAYCDYYRFMSGWGYWGSGDGQERVQQVLDRLDGGQKLATEEDYQTAMLREFG